MHRLAPSDRSGFISFSDFQESSDLTGILSIICLAPSPGLGVYLAPISARCVLDEILGNQHQLSQHLESQMHTYLD